MYFNRFTQGAKTAINLGKSYAKGLGHRVVGTEHLVVGLLREKDGKIVDLCLTNVEIWVIIPFA